MRSRRIETEELVIVDAEGRSRIILRTDEHGAVFDMSGGSSKHAIVLRVDSDTQEGDRVSLNLYGDGNSMVTLSVGHNGLPQIYLSEETGDRRIQAGVSEYGGISIDLIDMKRGNINIQVSEDQTEIDLSRHGGHGVMISTDSSSSAVYVAREGSSFAAGMGVDDGDGWVSTFDDESSIISSL